MLESLINKRYGELNKGLIREAVENSADHSTLSKLRLSAAEKAAVSVPGVPDEAWRNVKIDEAKLKAAALNHTKSTLASSGDIKALSPEQAAEDANFSNFLEKYIEQHEKRSSLRRLRANDVVETGFMNLSKSISNDFIFICAEGTDGTVRIKVEDGGEGSFSAPLIFVYAKGNAEADIAVEMKGCGISTPWTAVLAEENSKVKLSIFEEAHEGASLFPHEDIIVGRNAEVSLNIISISRAQLMRQSRFTLAGEAGGLNLNILADAKDGAFNGVKTSCEQNAAHTGSSSLVKSVSAENANVVKVCNIIIPKGCPKSEGKEKMESLITGEGGRAKLIPELEIVENDVVCSHGASISSPNEEALFMLKARGINEEDARAQIIGAFYKDIIEKMKPGEELKSAVYSALSLNPNSEYTLPDEEGKDD